MTSTAGRELVIPDRSDVDDESGRLDRLIRTYFWLSPDTPLTAEASVESLGATDWTIIELALAVEAEFGMEIPAEQALALTTVGDWRRLVRSR